MIALGSLKARFNSVRMNQIKDRMIIYVTDELDGVVGEFAAELRDSDSIFSAGRILA